MKLYVGLSPYWHKGKKASELSNYYYEKLVKLWLHVLFTYYNVKDFENWVKFISFYAAEVDVMLDSGAFSVWRMGGQIDLEAFTAYALQIQEGHAFKDLAVVSLDKIPGSVSTAATRQQVLDAADQSYNNYMFMYQRGVRNVIAVYHLGEPLDCLARLLDAGVDYIGLGGLARGSSDRARKLWLDGVFSFLKQSGSTARMHGFGITASSLVTRYPWYSVDSVTPMMAAGLGNVFIFDEKRKRVRTVYVQGLSADKKVFQENKQFLESYFGVSFEDLKVLWCRRYFSHIEWLKFVAWVNQRSEEETQSVIQPSLGLENL